MQIIHKAACSATGGFLVLFLLNACAVTPQSDHLLQSAAPDFAKPVELTQTPFFPQEKYQCGPAALATILQTVGVDVRPELLKEQIYIPARQGSLQIEMMAAARRYGLIPYVLRPDLEALLHEVRRGRPVLVLQNQGLGWYPAWHYAVLIGYNLREESLLLRSGTTARYEINLQTFERTWQRGEHWAMIALPPGQLPVHPDERRYFKAIAGFEQLKNWPVLNQAYAAGIRQWPTSRELHMGYGNARYAQGDLHEAGHHYRMVMGLYPDFAPAHNNLAQVLAKQGDFKRALFHVQQAMKLGGVHSAQYLATYREIMTMMARLTK